LLKPTEGGEAFEQSATDEPIVSDELDYLLPDIWLKSHPDQTWTIAHIRRAESYAKDV